MNLQSNDLISTDSFTEHEHEHGLHFSVDSSDINNNESHFENNYDNNDEPLESLQKNNNAEEPYILVDIPKTFSSHAFCFICKRKSGTAESFND